MRLCDLFRPPFTDRRSWEGFHGAWPTMIVIDLGRNLPHPAHPVVAQAHDGDVSKTASQTSSIQVTPPQRIDCE
jgi:hypothetical protein